MKYSRRTFIKQIGALAALMAYNPVEAAKKISNANVESHRRLTILHTNDVHSHIEPFPASDSRYAGLGGYARRKAYIDSVKAEGNDVLVFESGDMFQGTPYFNMYEGRLEIELMNKMGVDAVTIGNHEFDNGLDTLCNRIEEANFPFLNANYTFYNERAKKLIKPYTIFERAGRKIGVIGLGVKVEGLINVKKADGTTYSDPIEIANTLADKLRAEGCAIVIALTHIGYEMTDQTDDKTLAQASRNIDMILGGHSHTFLPSPIEYINTQGKTVWVNQVGFGGINVGRFDIEFDNDNNVAIKTSYPKVIA